MAYLSSLQPKEVNLKPKQTLRSRVASARETREELEPMDSVLTVFPDQPPLDRLHIVVRMTALFRSPQYLPPPR